MMTYDDLDINSATKIIARTTNNTNIICCGNKDEVITTENNGLVNVLERFKSSEQTKIIEKY